MNAQQFEKDWISKWKSGVNGAVQSQGQPSGADGHEFDGLCEAYAEQQKYGKTGIYPSAIAAWNNTENRVQGTSGLQPGDQIFFAPNTSNGNFGHTGIYQGNGKFTSATYNGVQTNDLNDWQKNTGQSFLGFIPS